MEKINSLTLPKDWIWVETNTNSIYVNIRNKTITFWIPFSRDILPQMYSKYYGGTINQNVLNEIDDYFKQYEVNEWDSDQYDNMSQSRSAINSRSNNQENFGSRANRKGASKSLKNASNGNGPNKTQAQASNNNKFEMNANDLNDHTKPSAKASLRKSKNANLKADDIISLFHRVCKSTLKLNPEVKTQMSNNTPYWEVIVGDEVLSQIFWNNSRNAK